MVGLAATTMSPVGSLGQSVNSGIARMPITKRACYFCEGRTRVISAVFECTPATSESTLRADIRVGRNMRRSGP